MLDLFLYKLAFSNISTNPSKADMGLPEELFSV